MRRVACPVRPADYGRQTAASPRRRRGAPGQQPDLVAARASVSLPEQLFAAEADLLLHAARVRCVDRAPQNLAGEKSVLVRGMTMLGASRPAADGRDRRR